MPDPRRASCRNCHRHRSACGPISWSGLCGECGLDRGIGNIVAMATKDPAVMLQWRRQLAASIGAVLVDDLREAP